MPARFCNSSIARCGMPPEAEVPQRSLPGLALAAVIIERPADPGVHDDVVGAPHLAVLGDGPGGRGRGGGRSDTADEDVQLMAERAAGLDGLSLLGDRAHDEYSHGVKATGRPKPTAAATRVAPDSPPRRRSRAVGIVTHQPRATTSVGPTCHCDSGARPLEPRRASAAARDTGTRRWNRAASAAPSAARRRLRHRRHCRIRVFHPSSGQRGAGPEMAGRATNCWAPGQNPDVQVRHSGTFGGKMW